MPSSSSLSILVFTKTAGYRHESISAGIEALKKFAAASDLITCDTTEDASVINLSSLSQYRVLVFLHTSGDFLDKAQLDALKGFIRNGGGFVGIHGAAAGMPQDEWYGRLVGAAFTEHPKPQDGVVKIEEHGARAHKGFVKPVEMA